MTKTKHGEAQIVQAFTVRLNNEINNSASIEDYCLGDFSGMQDKTYADFFAGVNSKNILIEFKEYKHEIKSESRKSLRELMCINLDQYISGISCKCHFLAWNDSSSDEVNIKLSEYIDMVCPIFNLGEEVEKLLQEPNEVSDIDFIDSFLSGRAGENFKAFKAYISYLDLLDKEKGDGGVSSFKALLYSYSNMGELKITKINSLDELVSLKYLYEPNNSQSLEPPYLS